MTDARTTLLASLIVAALGILWGVYWVPVRALDDAGLAGAWGTLAVVAVAALILAPFALRDRAAFGRSAVALIAVFFGGVAFVMYSVGFVYGRVAIIILLFYLTPVWSTLIARYVMGWETPLLRLIAIGFGVAGLGLVLSAGGSAPIPQNVGEWLALVSGIIWAVTTTVMRVVPRVAPVQATFVFALGATAGAAVMAPLLSPWSGLPDGTDVVLLTGIVVFTGGIWWSLLMVGLMWATPRLDPARVGILLMSEVLVGSVTAALFAGEALGPLEIAGGILVLIAGLLEIWPVPTKRRTKN